MDACNNLSAVGYNQNPPNFQPSSNNVDINDPTVQAAIVSDPRIGFTLGLSEKDIADIIQNSKLAPLNNDTFSRSTPPAS